MKLSPSNALPSGCRFTSCRSRLKFLGLAWLGLAAGTLPAAAATYSFIGVAPVSDDQYTTPANWSGVTVPNTSNGDTAIIGNGQAVTYTPGGDLTIGNGGMLQVTNGSFTQAGGNNYIQLAGNGAILVNGGTFNQGTASSTPFNLTGTGNAFTLSAGAANFNTSFSLNVGLTFKQSGGILTVTGNETDFNGGGVTLSGGTFNTKLITGVNAGQGVTAIFNVSGGTLNLTGSGFNGIYAGGTTQYINFTPGSTGKITFSSGSTQISDVQGFVNSGAIEYNGGGTGTLSNFNITSSGGVVTLQLVGVVPEPSTVAAVALGVAGLMGWTLRRRRAS